MPVLDELPVLNPVSRKTKGQAFLPGTTMLSVVSKQAPAGMGLTAFCLAIEGAL